MMERPIHLTIGFSLDEQRPNRTRLPNDHSAVLV
jgi:hypothetical protein